MDRIKKNIDLFGLFTSGLCALHCLAIPFLLSFGLAEGLFLEATHDSFELIVLSITMVLASVAVVSGLRKHANLLPLALFGLGLIVVFIGFSAHGLLGHSMMAIGGIIIASAHLVNHKMSKPKLSV